MKAKLVTLVATVIVPVAGQARQGLVDSIYNLGDKYYDVTHKSERSVHQSMAEDQYGDHLAASQHSREDPRAALPAFYKKRKHLHHQITQEQANLRKLYPAYKKHPYMVSHGGQKQWFVAHQSQKLHNLHNERARVNAYIKKYQ